MSSPVYFVAHIRIHDAQEYKKYLAACDAVFSQFQGQYLAVDSTPLSLEGEKMDGRTIIIHFPTERDFRQWYESKEYQQILKHRLAGAHCLSQLVHGL